MKVNFFNLGLDKNWDVKQNETKHVKKKIHKKK